MKYKNGDYIILTCDEYSNYSILDGYVAVVDFDTDVVINLFLDERPEQADTGMFETDDFESWLVASGTVKRLELIEWNVSTYGTAGAELSLKHQAYQDMCVKRRKDEVDAEYAAHPERFMLTGCFDLSVADGPKRKDKDEGSRFSESQQAS